MKMTIDDKLNTLYELTKTGNYSIRFSCGLWDIRNNTTCDGIVSDSYTTVKKWIIKDINK